MITIHEANILYRRVEPDVQFSCDVDYDPFKYMREHELKYGKCQAKVSRTKEMY